MFVLSSAATCAVAHSSWPYPFVLQVSVIVRVCEASSYSLRFYLWLCRCTPSLIALSKQRSGCPSRSTKNTISNPAMYLPRILFFVLQVMSDWTDADTLFCLEVARLHTHTKGDSELQRRGHPLPSKIVDIQRSPGDDIREAGGGLERELSTHDSSL